MRRPLLWFGVSGLVLLASSALALDQGVDQIIQKHFDARGGYDKLKSLQTLKLKERALLNGEEILITVYYKRPYLYRMEQVLPRGDEMVRVVNGRGAWVIMGTDAPIQRPRFAANHQREYDADMDGILVNYKAKGHHIELGGEHMIDGEPTYELKVTLASGAEQIIYLDKNSLLVRKQIRTVLTPQGDMKVVNVYSDYKNVDGLMFAFGLESDQGGQSVHIDVLSVEPNAPLDDDLFTVQEEKPLFTDVNELDDYLHQQTADNLFSGVVFVTENWEPMFQKAYGYSNKHLKTANNMDTKFNIGSINKMFTAVAILQLAQKGMLDLDDPLAKYLLQFPPQVAQKITIRHLLQHRSGWGAYWDNETFLARRSRLRTIDDYMAFIKDIPLDFEPGTRQQYSNTGYEVLGAVIEKASGRDYHDYVRRYIYEPAGMENTDAYEVDTSVVNLALGYTNKTAFGGWADRGEGYERENTSMKPVKGTAAGGGYSTAGDLLRFLTAFRTYKLLNPRFTAIMQNEFNDVEPVPDQLRGANAFAGGAAGINASCYVDYGRGGVVIVLCNYDPPIAEEVTRRIVRMLWQ